MKMIDIKKIINKAGIDEVGRGPLAGPVLAAAVILDVNKPIAGLKDSKKLSSKQRDYLYDEIIAKAKAFAIGRAEVEEIDAINILQASLLAMQRAVASLPIKPDYAVVDGIHCPKLDCPVEAIIGGDDLIAEISAASIIAKVTRDREMQQLHELFPQYGFDKHKGYATVAHRAALIKYGASNIHRKSFAPVAKLISL